MSHKSDKTGITDSDCLEAFDHLYAYLNGELTGEPLAIIEHHLSHCRSCFSRMEMERELNSRIQDSGKDKTPEALQQRLYKLLDDF